jgi:hypothetical protein
MVGPEGPLGMVGPEGPQGMVGPEGPMGLSPKLFEVENLTSRPDLFCYKKENTNMVLCYDDFKSDLAFDRIDPSDPTMRLALTQCSRLGKTYHCHNDEKARLVSMLSK